MDTMFSGRGQVRAEKQPVAVLPSLLVRPRSLTLLAPRAPAPQPFQEKPETAEYRVVYNPHVAIRDKPWGKVIGKKSVGDTLKTSHRSVGLPDGTWVKTASRVDGFGEPGWLLVDGASINLGSLLAKVETGRKGMVTRYRVISANCDIRERPSLGGTPVVGKRSKGALLRTDQELNGFVRLQADFYQTGKADPCEGWAMISGKQFNMGPILLPWEPTTATASATIGGWGAQSGQTTRYWVVALEGTPVRERPWGRVLCHKRRGMLLRCDTEKDGCAPRSPRSLAALALAARALSLPRTRAPHLSLARSARLTLYPLCVCVCRGSARGRFH